MNVEKLDKNCYYYTDLIPKEEYEYLLSILKQPEDWVKIYNKGWVYNPNRDPELKENRSGMIAFRKEFNGKKYPEINKIISKAFNVATEHYAKEKKLDKAKPFNQFGSIDKHCPGTVYNTHVDTAPVDLETYSILFYLNDDYEGGEISFSLPTPGKKIEVVNGNLAEGPNGLYPPDHEKNKDLVSFWLKPKACSILIFPPLYPHTAYEVRSGDKYLIKGHWQVEEGTSTKFFSDPYVNLDGTRISGQDLKDMNPGAKIEGIVPDEYKKFYI
jgi:hypothetical protein